jgi:DNA modification methylase
MHGAGFIGDPNLPMQHPPSRFFGYVRSWGLIQNPFWSLLIQNRIAYLAHTLMSQCSKTLKITGKSLDVQLMPLGSIRPYEFNNRRHNEKQIERIAASIKEFGFNQPIVIDAETSTILVGHGRLYAAQKLGLAEVPVLTLKGLNETQKKAYRLLDNKLQNDSTWDFDNVDLELGFLEDHGFDLKLYGLDDLRGLYEEPKEVKEDGFDPASCDDQEIYIKRGDLIELGRHTVLCGDATSLQDCERLMGKTLAALFITDPPYGVSYASKNEFLNSIAPANRIQVPIENDAHTPLEMKTFWESAFRAAVTATSGSASYYIFGPQGGDLMMMMSIKDAGWQLKHMLVWVKNAHVLGRSDYNYKHEPIWFGWKEKKRHVFYGSASEVSTWEYDKPLSNDLHPTMKPVALIARAITNSSKADDAILDLFLGSGTTLIACEQLDRTCYGMEIEPRYCQVIIERYRKYCQDNGKAFDCKINGKKFDANPTI